MAKLEVEFEITGFKLRIKGESDDVAARVTDVQRKMQGAFQALGGVGDGAIFPNTPTPLPVIQLPSGNGDGNGTAAAGTTRTRRPRRTPTSLRVAVEAIELKHDAETYGFPSEDWNTATKSMWLLYIAEKQATKTELSAPIIAETFNKHFRRFGAIRQNNVGRDLSNTQAKNHTVANNANVDPQTWYLLDSGKKEIEAKIKNATAKPAQ